MLLHRIPATKVMHSLQGALDLIRSSGKVDLNLKDRSLEFLRELDATGKFRYFEVSIVWRTSRLFDLDRLVWELRRFCTLDESYAKLQLHQGVTPVKYKLPGGTLEEIIETSGHPGRRFLLWNNCFLGNRERRTVRFRNNAHFKNAPLYMHPELLDDLLPLVFLPKNLVAAWREHKAPGYEVPPDK
jgi:hypothetical protein